MLDSYPAKYSDAFGTESTTITNDSKILRLMVRGVEFSGRDFDSLEPQENSSKDDLRTFTRQGDDLDAFSLEFQIPIPIAEDDKTYTAPLTVKVVIGDFEREGRIDREGVSLALEVNHHSYVSSGKSGWFEDELIELQNQLPENMFMRACINCLYSDYSPYGHGCFGWMMCFRNLKSEYLKVKSKNDFWSVHDHFERHVQETYLCPEFERRIPGTGYRG